MQHVSNTRVKSDLNIEITYQFDKYYVYIKGDINLSLSGLDLKELLKEVSIILLTKYEEAIMPA